MYLCTALFIYLSLLPNPLYVLRCSLCVCILPLIRFSNRLPVRAWPPLSGHQTAGISIWYRIQGRTTVLLRYKTSSSKIQGRFIGALLDVRNFQQIFVFVVSTFTRWYGGTVWTENGAHAGADKHEQLAAMFVKMLKYECCYWVTCTLS
jgi:hypothetical protein